MEEMKRGRRCVVEEMRRRGDAVCEREEKEKVDKTGGREKMMGRGTR